MTGDGGWRVLVAAAAVAVRKQNGRRAPEDYYYYYYNPSGDRPMSPCAGRACVSRLRVSCEDRFDVVVVSRTPFFYTRYSRRAAVFIGRACVHVYGVIVSDVFVPTPLAAPL